MNIIVTGAASGIGYHAALQLAANPAHHVYAIARRLSLLNELVVEHKLATRLENITPLAFDLCSDSYDMLYDNVLARADEIHILINNAGALVNKPFDDCTDADLQHMLNSNYVTAFKTIKECLPFMNAGAHVLNIGSMGGYQGSDKFPGLALYSAAKAALHTLTECLAKEYAAEGIKFNCLALGSADTDMLQRAFPGYKSPVSAADMGAFVARFAMEGNKMFNGKVLPVAGLNV